jgi:hypothetical protein
VGGEVLESDTDGLIGSRNKVRKIINALEAASNASAATGVLIATAMGKKLFQPPALCSPIKKAFRAKALL